MTGCGTAVSLPCSATTSHSGELYPRLQGEGDWQLYVFILFFHFVCALRYVCMCGHSLIPSEGESLRELKQSSASLVRNPLIAQATRVHALSSLCFRHTLLLRSDPAVCVCSHGSCSLIGDTAYVLLLSPSPCTSHQLCLCLLLWPRYSWRQKAVAGTHIWNWMSGTRPN